MIDIIPAMDLIGGKCVRLTQGDFSRETVYSDDPLDTAKRFEACLLYPSDTADRAAYRLEWDQKSSLADVCVCC